MRTQRTERTWFCLPTISTPKIPATVTLFPPAADASGHLPSDGRVVEMAIEDELKDSYLTYAMSVIVSRALPRRARWPQAVPAANSRGDERSEPDARILASQMRKISGDTSGNYHPHGESVIYPTLVRMARNGTCATSWSTSRAISDRSPACRRRPCGIPKSHVAGGRHDDGRYQT